MLDREKIIEVLTEIGDTIHPIADVKLADGGSEATVFTAYQGRDFAWNLERLRQVEEKLGVIVLLKGGVTGHIVMTLFKGLKEDASREGR